MTTKPFKCANVDIKKAIAEVSQALHDHDKEFEAAVYKSKVARLQLETELMRIRSLCKHTKTKYYSDPAGDSGTTECLLCGKEW